MAFGSAILLSSFFLGRGEGSLGLIEEIELLEKIAELVASYLSRTAG